MFGGEETAKVQIAPPKARRKEPEVTQVPPRKPCLEHREKVFIFSDGSRIASCAADGCMWGSGHADDSQFRKTHSDGSKFHEAFVAVSDEPELEGTDVEEELSTSHSERAPVAGEDIDVDVDEECDEFVAEDAGDDADSDDADFEDEEGADDAETFDCD
jgi:hypothetical protein